MKLARIISPFALSAVLFVLAYLSSLNSDSGYFPIILLGIGVLLTIVGISVLFSAK